MSVCVITGVKKCRCVTTSAKRVINSEDYRVALRRVFSDHSWYTSSVISESLPLLQPNAEFVTKRVLENPAQIKQVLLPLTSSAIADNFEKAVAEHLKLAAATLEPARNGDTARLTEAVNKFYAQGDDFGRAIYSLNMNGITEEAANATVREHNEFVVKLVTLRKEQNYEEYIRVLDVYNTHMMMMADTIYDLLKNK